MKRIFAALKIEPQELLMSVYYNLKSACKYDRINWVDPANIHITLKFFGETHADRIPEIKEQLQSLAKGHQPLELSLKGLGVFGSAYKPRVVWAGIEPNEGLDRLGQEVLNDMENIGFEQDRQNFVPHLTLGRIKYTDNKQRFFDVIKQHETTELGSYSLSSFELFESKLSSSGPSYTVLESFGLLVNT